MTVEMTNEELQRIREYSAKIEGTDGSLSVLTLNESIDLEMLIKKRLDEINGEEEFAYERRYAYNKGRQGKTCGRSGKTD